MKRIIKFRGKRRPWWVPGGNAPLWFYGELGISKDGIKFHINDNENGMCVQVVPSTVGQFTGLLDRDGKEIYEGDIIQFDCDGPLYLVEWNGDYAGFYYRLPGYMGNDLSTYEAAECTIAGNIHDNSELLTQSHDTQALYPRFAFPV